MARVGVYPAERSCKSIKCNVNAQLQADATNTIREQKNNLPRLRNEPRLRRQSSVEKYTSGKPSRLRARGLDHGNQERPISVARGVVIILANCVIFALQLPEMNLHLTENVTANCVILWSARHCATCIEDIAGGRNMMQ